MNRFAAINAKRRQQAAIKADKAQDAYRGMKAAEAALNARIDAYGADGLGDWLEAEGFAGKQDIGGDALGIIRRRLGVNVWKQMLEVLPPCF